MADLSQGNHANLILNPGEAYRISTVGVATVEVIYGAPAGTTTVTASTQDFGPYLASVKLKVTATSGQASYTLRTAKGLQAFDSVLDPDSSAALAASRFARPVSNKLSEIGDSRTIDSLVAFNAPYRKSAKSWRTQSNAFMGQTLEPVANYGISNKRSDEYLAEANFAPMLSDASALCLFGYPAVNDISQAQAGYTDADGNAVTTSNVAALVCARILNRVNRVLAAGKFAVVSLEPGAESLNSSGVAAVYALNTLLRSTFGGMAGVRLFDPLHLVWNPSTTTATQIRFKTGFSPDGTHPSSRQGRVVGKWAAANFWPGIITPRKRYGLNLDKGQQLYGNIGFATLTGGTTTNITAGDAIPANCRLISSVGSTITYTLTSAAAEDGSGNELTVTFTASGAATATFALNGVSTAGLAYTDFFVAGADIEMLQKTNAQAAWYAYLFATEASETAYDLYEQAASDIAPTSPMSGVQRMQNIPATFPATAASGMAVEARFSFVFSAAGVVQFKIKDPVIFKVLP